MWHESAAFGSAVDPAESSDAVGLQEMVGHALVTVPDPRGRKNKENDKMGDEALP